MDKQIVVKLKLPRARWVAVVIMLAFAAVAYAAVPHTFNAGDQLSSSALNDNFRVLEHPYCGSTSPVMPRLAPSNGYAGGAMLCAAVAGCGPTAHICSTADMVRHAAANGTTPDGWIATGMRANATDCDGFTSNTTVGVMWSQARAFENNCANATTLPLLCCL
jgi:hypothetical protein